MTACADKGYYVCCKDSQPRISFGTACQAVASFGDVYLGEVYRGAEYVGAGDCHALLMYGSKVPLVCDGGL